MANLKAIMRIESYSTKDGMLVLSVNDSGVKTALKSMTDLCENKHGGYVKLEISPPYKARSTGKYSQNHHLNGHIMQICQETKNSYEAIKYCIKMLAVEEMSYPYELVDGHIYPKGERYCNTQECAKLIEAAHVWAAHHGIVLEE